MAVLGGGLKVPGLGFRGFGSGLHSNPPVTPRMILWPSHLIKPKTLKP